MNKEKLLQWLTQRIERAPSWRDLHIEHRDWNSVKSDKLIIDTLHELKMRIKFGEFDD